MNSKPYLSFVIAARNDDYGGDFLGRFRLFLNGLAALSAENELDAEVVIVEWNPPQDRVSLKEAVAWPRGLRPGAVRMITVPGEFHRQLPNSDRMPMFEYRAKNVGIRRARGDFVLVTNPDILFSDKILRQVSQRELSEDRYYRADRYDVDKTIPLEWPVDRQLRFCVRHTARIQRREGTVPGSTLRCSYELLRRNVGRLYPPRLVRGLARRLSARATAGPEASNHGRPWVAGVHLNASGDFLLMARDKWHLLRGYPELHTHSHIDSYMVILAAVSGLRQVIFPFPIYHQEHDRSEHTKRPLTVLEEIPGFRKMIETGDLEIPNDKSWGLGGVALSAEEMR